MLTSTVLLVVGGRNMARPLTHEFAQPMSNLSPRFPNRTLTRPHLCFLQTIHSMRDRSAVQNSIWCCCLKNRGESVMDRLRGLSSGSSVRSNAPSQGLRPKRGASSGSSVTGPDGPNWTNEASGKEVRTSAPQERDARIVLQSRTPYACPEHRTAPFPAQPNRFPRWRSPRAVSSVID